MNSIIDENIGSGVYSFIEYEKTNKIEYGNDAGLKFNYYPKYSSKGFVTRENSKGKSTVVWCSDVAPVDHTSEINTVNIVGFLDENECFEVITDINKDISDSPKWQTKQLLMVPPKHMGIVQHPDMSSSDPACRVGYVIIVSKPGV